MSRAFTPKVVTANRLLEGDVVYLNAQNEWVDTLADAKLFTDEIVANIALAYAETLQSYLAGAYLANAALDADGIITSTHFRETFRATGPSNYYHGKQASAQ